MDDIRVYDYAVSEEEIPGLMIEDLDPEHVHDPQPEHKEKGVLVDGLTLRWKTGLDLNDPNFPSPDIEKHYLWVSKPYDPMNPPGGPDWGDPSVQTFTIGADTNPADGNVDPNASKAVPGLQKDSLYFWAVDEAQGNHRSQFNRGIIAFDGVKWESGVWDCKCLFSKRIDSCSKGSSEVPVRMIRRIYGVIRGFLKPKQQGPKSARKCLLITKSLSE